MMMKRNSIGHIGRKSRWLKDWLRIFYLNKIAGKDKMASSLKIVINSLAIAAIFLASMMPVRAMPPYRPANGLAKSRPGTEFRDSYYLKNIDRLRAMGVNSPGDLLAARSLNGFGKASVSGNVNILTILVDFSDKTSQVAAIKFDTLIYVNIAGTVTNYYREVSYNTLTITTVTLPSSLGWIRMDSTYAFYCDTLNGFGTYPRNVQKLVEDAVDAVNPLVNFAQFDNNGDTFVDGLIVVHSGPGAEFTGAKSDIWSHKWSITPRLRDGVYISTYSMEPEYWQSPGDMTCGVYCHELGHVFGLPDLYDTDDPAESEGIGNWSLMAGGSWNGTLGNSPAHPDAWCKIQLGFVTATVLTLDQNSVSIPAVKDSAKVFKLWTSGTPGNEYFLAENRQKTGYDAQLPGDGLLIWHVDDTQGSNDNQWWPGCGWSSHYKVALVQADNLWQMEHNLNRGNNGDPYPGGTTNRIFNAGSSPNSNAYSGSASSVAITNISNSGLTMTADMAVGMPQSRDEDDPALPAGPCLYQNYPNPFNANTEIEFRLARPSLVKIAIYDITGRQVKELFSGALATGIHRLNWNGAGRDNRPVNSGIYFCRLNAGGNDLYRKMVFLK